MEYATLQSQEKSSLVTYCLAIGVENRRVFYCARERVEMVSGANLGNDPKCKDRKDLAEREGFGPAARIDNT